MLSDAGVEQVYLACGATDLRTSIDGLAALVQEAFALDPFAPALFVFCNRPRDKVKILHWAGNGFWLYYKRLERGTFRLPRSTDLVARAVSRRQLRWLLDGLNLEQQQAHPALAARPTT